MTDLIKLVCDLSAIVEGYDPNNKILDRVEKELSRHENDKAGEVSDGYHTFNELYAHRIALYLALVSDHPGEFWKSKKHEDGSSFEGWFILGGNLGTGDISYHLPLSMWGMAKCEELPVGKKWDGHTPTDVVGRLSAYAAITPAPVERDGLREAIRHLIKQCRGINYEYKTPASISVDELEELLSRHPSPSVSTEELIAVKCLSYLPHEMNGTCKHFHEGKCDFINCRFGILDEQDIKIIPKPIDGKEVGN